MYKKIGMTEFKRKLANLICTTLSNIYEIIKDSLITVYDYGEDYYKHKNKEDSCLQIFLRIILD